MKKNLLFIFITILAITFSLVSIAEAKRFGGGSSFGSKKSYSSPFKQKSNQQKSFSQQKAASTNQQRKQQLSSRGGLMGMLGGLALGGLLGALFFGGAFENFNFFDFLIIGGIIFAVIWFMKRKKPAPRAQSSAPGGFNVDMEPATDFRTENKNTANQHRLDLDKKETGFTDNFSAEQTNSTIGKNKKDASFAESFGMSSSDKSQSVSTSQTSEVILPDWFNQEEFLAGARSAYTLLQEAWDNGDLESIRGLTTDTVYTEITKQIAEEPSQGATRIMQLNAELVDFNELSDRTEASVLFDALLGETDSHGHQERAAQARELWHFVQGKNSTEPTWYLDGIQQLA